MVVDDSIEQGCSVRGSLRSLGLQNVTRFKQIPKMPFASYYSSFELLAHFPSFRVLNCSPKCRK